MGVDGLSAARASPGTVPPPSRIRLIVEAARVLHGSGAESDRTETRVRQLAAALNVQATAHLGWSTSAIEIDPQTAGRPQAILFAEAPAALALNRVVAVDRVVDALTNGRESFEHAAERIHAAAALPPARIGIFVAACAVGACALALILGARHPGTYLIIAGTAALGAIGRRLLGRYGLNNYWQVGAAALLAGIGGAVANALHLSSPLGLAALCSCMVLVPGPHLLKGALDVGTLRIGLGIDRLVFATITLVAITIGVLIGLSVGGSGLSVDPASRLVPIWLDVPAAGVVAVCYGIFYSTPIRMLVWPFWVGLVAHGLRWVALEIWQLPAWLGAGLACLLVGAVLQPVALRRSIPFSAIGFASVVSLIPGVLVFRALAGLIDLASTRSTSAVPLLIATVNDGVLALQTVLAMAVGFLVPAAIWRQVLTRHTAS